ncbi:MAG: tandem-95 repeat protein [Candidatus Cloacimonetes bacterium]|nr:tandem-95 repeat protein [Candidatus Cloacimonadota bacterium]
MFRLFLLLAFFCSSEAATYGKKAPVPKNTSFFVDWVLDGRFWKASSGRFGLALKNTPSTGLGIYRVSKDKIESGRPAQNRGGSLRIKVRESGYALLDFQLGSPADPKDLLFENSCLDSIHQYQNDGHSYHSYFYSEEITSSSKSTLRTLDPKLPVFVKTSLPNCEISSPGFLQTVEVAGGGKGDQIKAPSLSFLAKSDPLLDKPQLRINEDHSYTLAKNSHLTMVWTANPGSYQDLWFFAELIFPDGSIWALSGKKLVANQDVTHTFLLQTDWLDSGFGILRLGLSREGESEPVQEVRIPLTVEKASGLRLQEQLARLVNQTHQSSSMPLIRFSQAQASTSFVSAPNEFLPGMVDSIVLTVSGAGIQTSSMTFSGDTSSARISLGLGTTPTIRLEYLDKSKDIIKIGSRTLSVSLSMPPVVLEPVPGPLPELLVSHPSGYFSEPMQVDFSASGTTIVYTTDQTDPKSSPSAIRVSDFFSLPVSKSATVLAFVDKDGQKSGTRRYVYNLETIPTIEPVILSPERFLNGYFDNELRVLFPAIPDRPLVKLWLNGEEKNLPYSVTISESMTAEYKAISERGFSSTTPDQIELNRVLVYHDVFHTIHTPSVGNLFAGTASVEFLSPETGYRFVYTTDETLPVTGSLEVDLPFTLELNQSTVILGHLIHPSGLKSDLIQKRFTQAPLPDPDTFPRDFVVMEDQGFSVDLLSVGMDEDLMVFIDEIPIFGTLELDDTILSYIPDPDYFGPDAFSLEFLHQSGLFLQLGFLVEVEGVNDVPVVTGDLNPVTNEDEIVEIDFFAFDPDLDVFDIQISMDPSQGNLFSTTDGRLFYEPAPNYFGQDSFSLTVSDQSTGIQIDFVVTVLPVNDAPILIVNPLSVMEDSSITTQVAGYDIEGDYLEYFLDLPPSNGQAVLLTDGELTYLPDPDFFGMDSFFITVSDGDLAFTTEVSVTVLPVNDYPKILLYSDADRQIRITSLSPDEDQTATIYFDLFDIDGDFVEFSTAPQPSVSMNISVSYESGTTLGMITIEPVADFFGDVSLSLLVCDGSSVEPEDLCTGTTVVLTYLPVNDAPILTFPFLLTGAEDETVTTQLLHFDIENDSVVFAVTTGPVSGMATLSSSGILEYRADSDFFGMDSISVSVTDTGLATGYATISIEILPRNDAPQISYFVDSLLAQTYTTQEFLEDSSEFLYFRFEDLESNPVSITATAILTGMVDFEIFPTTVTTGYILMTPYPEWFGDASLSLEFCDTTTEAPGSLCTTSVLNVSFLPVNDEPRLILFSDEQFMNPTSIVSLFEDSTTSIHFVTSDLDMDLVTVVLNTDLPVHGSFLLMESSLSFTPSTNWFGVQTAALQICDVTTIPPGSLCSIETLTFVVEPQNDAPIASFFSDVARLVSTAGFEFMEDELATIFFSVQDLEGESVSISLMNTLTSGTLAINTTAQTLTISAWSNFFGTDVAVLEFCDQNPATPPSLCSTYSLPILFHPVNDAPAIIMISASPITGDEDSSITFDFVITDIESSPLSVTLSSAPTKGTVTFPINTSGAGTYVPYPHENGVDSFQLSVFDGELTSEILVSVQINPLPDAPQITWPDVATSIITGSPYPLNPVVLDPDLPDDTLSYSWIMTTAPFVGAGEISNPASTEAMLLVTYPGMYQVELTATDSFALSDTETYTFVTKDNWLPTAVNIGLVTTPVFLAGSSYGKNLYFGWIGDDSRAEIRIQTASGWGTLSGTMATTIPAMVVRNYEDHVYVAYRDATSNNNISVAYSVGASMSLRRLGESGMAVVTSNAFDMAITRRGTPIVCYAKSLALAKPGCVYYNQYWYPLSEVAVLPDFTNIILLKMVLNLDEQPIVIHYDGADIRAHVYTGTAWASHGVVYTGADVAQIEASMNGLSPTVLLRLSNGATKVFVHTGSTTWASLEDPDLVDSAHVSLLADGRGSMYIASVQNDGSARVIRRAGSGWENSMISPPGSFGSAMTLIRKVGQPVLAHHQLNSDDPAVVRTLNSRLPLIVNATPSLGAMRVGTGQNLSLEWNRPLLAGSEYFVGVANKATPHTTLASVVTYSESTMPLTLLDPSSNLAPDSTFLLTVATGINDMQGFGVPTNMVMPFTTRRTTARIGDADFTDAQYPGSKDDYSIAIKPSGVGIDSKWVAWNRISNQNLATKFHTTGVVWVDADSSVTGFGPTGSAYPQIAFFGDTPWLVAKDQNGEMYAMSYNGTVWETSATNIAAGSVHQIVHKVGPRINAGSPDQYAMTLRGGTYALQLYKRDAPATTWSLVGGANIYDGISNHYDFTVFPDGKPVIAFATSSAPDQVIVSMFNGTSWVSVVPNLPFGPGQDYVNIRLQNWGNQLSLAAIHNTAGSKSIVYNTYNLDVGGDYWNIHNTYQMDVDNFDMAIVDAVPYIFAVKSDPAYTPVLVRGGLPHDLFWEFSSDLLPGTGISSVVDGKLAAHRGRLYLIYRDSSTYELNGWFLEP